MNKIKITPLLKEIIKGSHIQLDPIEIDLLSTNIITPEAIKSCYEDLDLNKLYGFNANISCDNLATVVISDFEYISIINFKNTETRLSHLKIYNVTDFARINGLAINRIDIENTNILCVDSRIKEFYYGIESYHEDNKKKNNLKNKHKTIDVRDTEIIDMKIFTEIEAGIISNTKIKRFDLKNNSNIFEFKDCCEIDNLFLNERQGLIALENVKIRNIYGNKKLAIKEYKKTYSTIDNNFNIFPENITNINIDTIELIKTSYLNVDKLSEYKHFSYLQNNILLKQEKKIGNKLTMFLLKITSGYGYKLGKAFRFIGMTIIMFSLIYFLIWIIGGDAKCGFNVTNSNNISVLEKGLYSIYHSIVTFATLGYGDTSGVDWLTRFLSSIEALIGIYSMSIVIFTMTRKIK